MLVAYRNPGFEHSIDSILLFQDGGTAPYWSDALLFFFPQLSRERLDSLDPGGRKDYLAGALRPGWEHLAGEIDRKAEAYSRHFLRYRGQIEDALSDAFETDAGAVFNDLSGLVCLNPVCPRFLEERYFDVFYRNSERGALGMSIHEVIHFFWFDAWNRHFGDSYAEYDAPSLKWILSEMTVECIMDDPRLASVNPYYPRENGGCVYPYFQDMVIGGKPVLDTLRGMYRGSRITDYMERSYRYCEENEAAIRRHIEEAEKRF